jgi:hypothetical protein
MYHVYHAVPPLIARGPTVGAEAAQLLEHQARPAAVPAVTVSIFPIKYCDF